MLAVDTKPRAAKRVAVSMIEREIGSAGDGGGLGFGRKCRSKRPCIYITEKSIIRASAIAVRNVWAIRGASRPTHTCSQSSEASTVQFRWHIGTDPAFPFLEVRTMRLLWGETQVNWAP